MTDWIGWLATAVFALSYAFKSPLMLRRIQASAAVLWIVYGISVKAAPVVAANGVAAALALLSSRRGLTMERAGVLWRYMCYIYS